MGSSPVGATYVCALEYKWVPCWAVLAVILENRERPSAVGLDMVQE